MPTGAESFSILVLCDAPVAFCFCDTHPLAIAAAVAVIVAILVLSSTNGLIATPRACAAATTLMYRGFFPLTPLLTPYTNVISANSMNYGGTSHKIHIFKEERVPLDPLYSS